MTQLTTAQIAGYASRAGFKGDALTKAVAIALAESGGRSDARGDVALQDSTWGPSLGLWQVRSLRAQTGTGRERDATRLTDPAFNAAAAWSISNHGKNFGPWTTYTNGAYLANMGKAAKAAGEPSTWDRVAGAGTGLIFGVGGAVAGAVTGKTNPVDSVGGVVTDAAGGVMGGLDAVGGFFGALGQRGTWVRVLQVVGGAGLVVAGVVIVGRGVVQDVAVAAIPGGNVIKAAAGG